MFIVTVAYTATTEEIDALRPSHIQWLKAAFARGNLKMAGPYSTKDGGLLITSHDDRESLETELKQDPYRIHNAATHQVAQFELTLTAWK